MSPEERELLNKSVSLAEENNDILRGMRRHQRFSSFLSLLYWLVILGSAFGAYYFIQPYIQPMLDIYTKASSVLKTVK